MEALSEPFDFAIPPTQDELPYEDGKPMETPKHREQMNLLIESLRAHLPDRPDVYIGGNMGVYYSMLQVRNRDFLVPDFFVVLDAVLERERKSWVLWEEEARVPAVVVELLSPSTESIDRGRKMELYASLRVEELYLFDPTDLRFEGYRLEGRSYAAIPPDAAGVVDCRAVGLRLAVREGTFQGRTTGWLRWIDANGEVLPSGEERARHERLNAESERVRAEGERVRAESERVRAESERVRAESERVRAERFAARLRAAGIDPDAE